MSCKEEVDEKFIIECVRSFRVIYNQSKKSYKDRIAKGNAWKCIFPFLENGRYTLTHAVNSNSSSSSSLSITTAMTCSMFTL
jgi:hypothetical protein